jgi:hypothetical protein
MAKTSVSAKKTAKKAPKKSATRAAKKTAGKPGPKDRDYVNGKQPYEVAYASKRKTPAKKFGSRKSAAE